MKVEVISRSAQAYVRETNKDVHKVQRNLDSRLHPLQIPREYKRALNAVKLDKIFAKPFLFSLSGHIDPVECLMKHPKSLSTLISGSFDGQIKVWDLMKRKCVQSIQAHDGPVSGLCIPQHGDYFFSCGDTNVIKRWHINEANKDDRPITSIVTKTSIVGIDHHKKKQYLITCGETIDLWDESRPSPLKTFNPTFDSSYTIKFNPIECDIFASTANDRSITLFDIRQNEHLRKVIMSMRTNNIAWNPMEGYHFTAANEDHNLYTFDMRNLSEPLKAHVDHISAVIDVDYSPTGRELVSGSYDKTLRIFREGAVHSREVYHTKRMQRLTSVLWTLDSKYILCGSDEMDIRAWKANASEKLGPKGSKEEINFRYQAKLKEAYAHHPEIKRIARHRHLPKHVYHGKKEKDAMVNAIKRKEGNKRAHSKPGTVPITKITERAIVIESE
ncbi:DDB1- and CUL4-associated factor 13-like [Panonychus citri]|uniref:DDB1- and CUL4-associated factor 13-like n=1 Tax=Panonychus citri TaxID=50023 RepID=UPI0023072E95|nr:DDB1- and CUL4-associated factor 13-like [Panonychus citri]